MHLPFVGVIKFRFLAHSIIIIIIQQKQQQQNPATELWSYWQMHRSEFVDSAWRSDLLEINKKKKYQLVDVAVTADHGVKIKESEKLNKDLGLVKELIIVAALKLEELKIRDHPDHSTTDIA